MKKYSTLVLLLLFLFGLPIIIKAQYPNFNTNLITKACDGNEISIYEHWSLYQTQNNTYNDTIINSCINVSNKGISVSNLDLNKKLFISWKADNVKPNRRINNNTLFYTNYSLGADLSVFDTTVLPLLTIIVEAKDTALGFEQKLTHTFNGSFNHLGCIIQDEFCFPTQKYEEQYLEEVIFEITLLNTALPTTNISISDFTFYDLFDYTEVVDLKEVPFVEDSDTIVQLSIRDLAAEQGWSGNYFFLHNKEGIPSLQNQDVKFIRLRPNPEVRQKIILTLNDYESLYFQEFTGIGTELVEGSDIVHHFTLEMDGGDMCLQSAELVFEDDDLILKKGNISFADQFSCLMFKEKSEFILNENTQLTYGEHGNGLLGMQGGHIILKDGAQLTIDCPIVLKNSFQSDNRVYLKNNSKLNFTKNVFFKEQGYLYIFGNKNQVDVSELNAKSRSKLIFIEDIKNEEIKQLKIYPNPYQNDGFLNVIAPDHSIVTIQNLNGQIISKKSVLDSEIDPGYLHPGIYILKYENTIARLLVTNQ